MSFAVYEKFQSRTPSDGDNRADARAYLCVSDNPGSDDEAGAVLAVRSTAPTTLEAVDGRTLVRKQVVFVGILVNGWYEVEARYASADTNKDTGESSFQFDTTGGQFKITQSKETVGRYKGSSGASSAPDLKGAINAKSDGEPEGVEITIPQFAFSETHYISDDDVTDTYKGYLYALTGRTNDDTFKGCAAGECLFLGARGSKRGRGDWEITFNFAASQNISGLSIGDVTGIAKKGWEYLWVRYQPTVVGSGADKIKVGKPQFVYVERVYDDGDFSLLDIGT